MKRNNEHVRSYIADAQNQISQAQLGANGERFHGADGFIDAGPFYKFTNDVDPGSFFSADGDGNGQANAALPISQPYAIQVSNASAATVQNFNIWLANTYLDTTRWSWANGSLTISGVTLSSVYGGNISYWSMLQQSQQNNFSVGKTYMTVVSGSNSQVTQPMSLTTIDMSGNQASKVIPNLISPNQFQSGVLENYSPYRIDGFTGVSITILASAVFQIYFYPSNNINPARGLAGYPLGRQYGNAPIGAPQKVMITN